MNKKNGFTLVEILIAMVIVVTIAIIMIGTFMVINPVAKSRDSQRKKDLNRIKQAFEEYFNDKGAYPQDVNNWNIKTNCDSDKAFSKYLSPWPCDPNGNPYLIIMEKNSFRVMTNLENKNDNDIPENWYTRKDIIITGITKNDVNYGISSPNILWYANYINPNCDVSICLSNEGGGCNSAGGGCNGNSCYYAEIFADGSRGGDCVNKCQTICCGAGCDQ